MTIDYEFDLKVLPDLVENGRQVRRVSTFEFVASNNLKTKASNFILDDMTYELL
ncbi:MAG: hypothetical protein O6914_02415 [Chloroflexi bacterium]|nr:hypothetical protein [Chloroflexota bacterium]MCZ6866957.1 hypothetical protein [Chloroflexota bacterium]